MYFTKFMLQNPTVKTHVVDPFLFERAQRIYKHFEDNGLFYVDDNRKQGHVFFDGWDGVEVTRAHVRFLPEVTSNEFIHVEFEGQQLVRHNRHLKPIIYYPIFNDEFKLRPGRLTDSENHLLSKYAALSGHCLYNRSKGWTVDFCDAGYPLKPSASLSMHTVKIQNWFKDQFQQMMGIESRCYGNRVSTVRFYC